MNRHLPYSNLNFYQNANADAEEVKDGFLIRHNEYDIIISDILRNPMEGSVQHYLLLGKRGSGKSTLLKRLQVEIDEKFDDNYVAVNTAEEQANVYRLHDLLHQILQELEDRHMTVQWPGEEDDEHMYNRKLFSTLHKSLEMAGKKVILLLDNIDRIFDNLGDDTSLLREYLLNFKDIKIIGASTRMTEHFWSYKKPFYEFFRVLELEPLSSAEVKKLLLSWSEKMELPQLKEFVENRPGQLETIRVLTDGLPRTLQFFVYILLRNEKETGYEYLQLIMDSVTPLYQERLNKLPAAQRKIVLQMAFLWESVGAKELSRATKMENRLISAQLNQLVEKRVAEKIETNTKNHLYRLSERFFNLWLIFTQGSSREKRKAKYLSIFLENFYDEKELREMAEKHLDTVREGKIAPDKAALLTKAYSQSRYIHSIGRDILIESTLKLPGMNASLQKELPLSISEIMEEVFAFARKKEWDKALHLVHTIEQEDGIKEYLFGIMDFAKGDLVAAEKMLLQSFVNGFFISSMPLARVYLKMEEFHFAEKYFIISLENKMTTAPYYLSSFYYAQNKQKEESYSILKNSILNDLKERSLSLLPVLQAWNADFESLEENLLALVQANNPNLEFTLTHLLIHHQVNLVHRLFTSTEFEAQLMEKFAPLYYVVQMLMPDARMAMLKIPPEIQDVVNDILTDIYRKRDFYYSKPPIK